MDKKKDSRLYNKNFIEAWKKATGGIVYAVKTQRNIKIQLCIAVLVIIFAIVFKVNITQAMFLTFATMLVIITEMVNTAIEETVNLVTNKFHPVAKIAKDVAAGAVVLSALNAVIIAMFIFVNKII